MMLIPVRLRATLKQIDGWRSTSVRFEWQDFCGAVEIKRRVHTTRSLAGWFFILTECFFISLDHRTGLVLGKNQDGKPNKGVRGLIHLLDSDARIVNRRTVLPGA